VEKHLQAPAAAMITTFRADRRFVIHTSPENWSVRN
jgi:hypothetical protein